MFHYPDGDVLLCQGPGLSLLPFWKDRIPTWGGAWEDGGRVRSCWPGLLAVGCCRGLVELPGRLGPPHSGTFSFQVLSLPSGGRDRKGSRLVCHVGRVGGLA